MESIYFKQHFESCEHERTVYGHYDKDNITPEGDICCKVFSIECDHEVEVVNMEICEHFFKEDEITPVSLDEYLIIIHTLEKAQSYFMKAQDLLNSLI